MGVSEYVPVAVAGCCAAAVAYIALSQAYAAAGDEEDVSKPSSSTTEASRQSQTIKTAAVNGHSTALEQHAGEAGASSSSDPAPTSSSSSAGSPETCNHCHKAPDLKEHLLRCARCYHAWYCSKECQKAAWPQHKRSCTTSPRATSNGSSSNTTSPRTAQNGAQASSSSSSSSNDDKPPGTVLDALKQVLQQHSNASADDPLQQQFEQAVLLFVSGEHRAAAAALQGVQAAAEAQGKKALAGDCCKWLGHSYLKAGDGGKAAAAFAKGCELAEQSGNKRLQVDCLSGLGTMHRDLGQSAPALGFLSQALRVASELGEPPLRASVLTLLGTVMMGSDGSAAIVHLEEAVGIREDQVITLHESGQRGSALASAIMEHAGSLVSLAGAYYVEKRYAEAADAYSKSYAIFDMVDDVEKQCKCLINLANLYEIQLTMPEARLAAAEQRKLLYKLTAAHVGRDAPETCAICCEAISPLKVTAGKEQQLLLLGCAHCFHYKCWEDWSDAQAATCPSCKQVTSEVPPQQHLVHTPPPPPTP